MIAPDLSRLLSLRTTLGNSPLDPLRNRAASLQARHANGTAPRPVVAHQLFQTPQPLAARLVALLGPVAGLRILEPSAGCGRLVTALLKAGATNITAIDQSADCVAAVGSAIHADFLTTTPDRLGLFDAIAMNPPFTRKSDIRHIHHALTFLKPGGKLAGLCLGTDDRRAALRPRSSEWHDIPAGTFRSEGTDVPTFLFLIQASASQ